MLESPEPLIGLVVSAPSDEYMDDSIDIRSMVNALDDGASPSFHELMEVFGDRYPLLRDLEDTEQDPVWHAEGNVGIHTEMVLEAVYEEANEADIRGRDRTILVLSALLHDVAKPVTTTTRIINGKERVVAPRHASKGASIVGWHPMPEGLTESDRRRLVNLIMYHQRPRWFSEDGRPERDWRRLSRWVDVELLIPLVRADFLGRECDDRDELLEWIELFEMQMSEWEWNPECPYMGWEEAITEHIRLEDVDVDPTFALKRAIMEYETGRISSLWEAVGRLWEYAGGKPEVVITCGPSGSGKSTWVQELGEEWGVVSMDDIRAEIAGDASDQSMNGQVRQEAQERMREVLREDGKVVWDATSLRRDYRTRISSIAKDYGGSVTIVVFNPDKETCLKANEQRDRTIPSSVIKDQFKKGQWPRSSEYCDVIVTVRDGSVHDVWGGQEDWVPFELERDQPSVIKANSI